MSAHFEMGREARLAGRTTSECPFAVGGPEWVHWMEGWENVDFSERVKAVETDGESSSAFEKVEAPTCSNCGRPGAHFVPPCFGTPGFYVCETLQALDSAVEPEDASSGD